jgi:GST-like protein
MFIAIGVGPFSGQSVHFKHIAPEPKDYAVNRYLYEAKWRYGIIDAHLSIQCYMAGETYTIVDMALWGWTRMVPFILGENAWGDFPNLKCLFDEISARPAAQAASALKQKHSFKAEMDDEARQHMFRHLAAPVS